MNIIRLDCHNRVGRCSLSLGLATLLWTGAPIRLHAADAAPVKADAAWENLQKDLTPPARPDAWQTRHPTQQEIEQYQTAFRDFGQRAADKAREFYETHPQSAHALDARKQEYQFLMHTFRVDDTNRVARLQAAGAALLKQPGLSEEERFKYRSTGIQLAAMSRQAADPKDNGAAFEQDVRALQKEFPDRPETWPLLLAAISRYDAAQARPRLQKILESKAPTETKTEARSLLTKLDRVGKALDLKFTSVDGREVDLKALKGKVVLVDFWATWCGPCVAEIPNVVKAYDVLHPKGFEIVGVSFEDDGTARLDLPNNPHAKSEAATKAIADKKVEMTASAKNKLTKFTTDKKMPWPQYFDGKGWSNKIGQEFGIVSIPAMWLVDKQGNLRDLDARGALEQKVEKLLAE